MISRPDDVPASSPTPSLPAPSVAGSTEDRLLAALRELPAHAPTASADVRLQREARAAFDRTFADAARPFPAAALLTRAAVPIFLAGIVGIYMTWAISAATALTQ